MNDLVIQTRGLCRCFGARAAVYELSLAVPRGSVFAFLGRNGSGKTTTIRMLLGLLPPTRGSGAVLGCDIRALTPELRARIGYVAEDHPLYGWMTVQESGAFQASFYPKWDHKMFQSVIDHFGLKPGARVKELSRGQRAGLSLALTLAPDPELLILDDPALGLDPVARRSLLESMVYLMRRPDRTIFFSTHQLADVERIADRVAVLDGSVLRASCRLETFSGSVRQFRLRFKGAPPGIPEIPGLLKVVRLERELRLTCVVRNGSQMAILEKLGAEEIESLPVGLEEALLSYLGERGEQAFIISNMEARQ